MVSKLYPEKMPKNLAIFKCDSLVLMRHSDVSVSVKNLNFKLNT